MKNTLHPDSIHLKQDIAKPQIGVIPEFLWLEERVTHIDHAMNRRIAHMEEIPMDWIAERNKHIQVLKDRRNEQGL